MPEQPDDIQTELVQNLRAIRERREANQRAVADGTADPRVLEVIRRVSASAESAPEGWQESMKHHAATIVTDRFDRANAQGEPFDPDVVAPDVEREIVKSIKNLARARRSLRWLTAAGSALTAFPLIGPLGALADLRATDIRSDLAEARRPLPERIA